MDELNNFAANNLLNWCFEQHFHLVNRADLEIILKAEVFVNEVDNQVRAAHKILGYDPI